MENNTKTQVYYGEYSLDHWIKLIKSGNIKLPKFQRKFTWLSSQIVDLLDSFEDDLFIPPVLIVRMKDDEGKVNNFVLDGQQRLTSIVLISQNKRDLKEKNKNANEIKTFWDNWECLKDENYYEECDDYGLDGQKKERFLQEHFLGFSFIIVPNADAKTAQSYCASMFHRINSTGTSLSLEQKMSALSYVSEEFKKLINASEKIGNNENTNKIVNKKFGLIRCLSFLSLYKQDESLEVFLEKLGNGLDLSDQLPTSLQENILYEYLYALIRPNAKSKEVFGDLTKIFPDTKTIEYKLKELESHLKALINVLNDNNDFNELTTIVEQDYYLFGLVYHSIFNEKELIDKKSEEFKSSVKSLREKIEASMKDKNTNKKKPNITNYILERINKSIEWYEPLFKKD